MLRREVVLVDDLTGAPAEHRVVIRLDGTTYALDLEERNAAALRAALEPWVSAARPTRRPPGPGPDPTEVRGWARRAGLRVASRGRLPAHVVAAYRAAHEAAPKEVHEHRRGGRPTG